jgi:Zn-finger nucleic acid-binding protein
MSCGGALQHQKTELKTGDGGCPRCGAALRERALTAVTVVECSSCGGLWLAPAVFDRVCGDAEISARTTRELAEGGAPRQTIDPGKVTYLPCPRCKDRMVRKNFGGSSGVILDVCRHDGIWLDHGELEKVVTFVRAGGLVEARRREVKRLEDEAREAKLKRDYAGGASGSGLDFGELTMPALPRGSGIFRLLCDMLFSR